MLQFTKLSKVALIAIIAVVLLFMYVPLFILILNSFNQAQVSGWPINDYSLDWWVRATELEAIRNALLNSAIVAFGAMVLASVFGSLIAFALARFDFFGRSTVNLLVVLPIALPGVVTGVAFSNTYSNFLTPAGFQIGYFGMIVAHATFCIVMVFNNVFARLKRMNPHLQEASMDLGQGLWGTFRLVTFPQFRSAFGAGALLAFALSFDEVVVTIFTAPPGVDTIPLWILKEMARPTQASVVNVVATVIIVLSLIPVYVSQRLSRSAEDEK